MVSGPVRVQPTSRVKTRRATPNGVISDTRVPEPAQRALPPYKAFANDGS
jgi:hypothetical protein